MNPATILVTDDECDIRVFVRMVLKTAGYVVLEAADGLDALDLASRHGGPIDLLLTDVRMPGLEGPELCRRIREIRPETRFLIMSGYSEPLVDPGVVFMAKPFTRAELLDEVRRVLENAVAV
jgi:CheY-like chemotaxis protein